MKHPDKATLLWFNTFKQYIISEKKSLQSSEVSRYLKPGSVKPSHLIIFHFYCVHPERSAQSDPAVFLKCSIITHHGSKWVATRFSCGFDIFSKQSFKVFSLTSERLSVCFLTLKLENDDGMQRGDNNVTILGNSEREFIF